MKRINLFLIFLVFAAVPARAQEARLQLESLEAVASKAEQVIDINLDGSPLKLAINALSARPGSVEAKIKEAIQGLKGVYVRRLKFEREGDYTPGDMAQVRSQLAGPMWSKIVGVRSNRSGDNIEVYMMSEGEKVQGITVINTAPKELVLVNLVGPVDLDKLAELARYFGLPEFEIGRPQERKE